MKLKDFINSTEWATIWNNAVINWTNTYQPLITSIANIIYIKYGYRSMRDIIESKDILTTFITSWLTLNKQKLYYLLETVSTDFLSIDNNNNQSANTDNENTNIDFNIDYIGGEGQRNKGTNNNTSRTTLTNTNKVIDNRNKITNFSDIMKNSLFYDLYNSIFESIEFNEDLTW